VLEHENKKDVNDRGKWQPKPARAAEMPAKLSDDAKLEAVKRAIGAFEAQHGIKIVKFDAKKHGVYSLIGAGAQPVCDISMMRLLDALDRADANVFISLRSMAYSAMSTRQLNGLHVGLLTKSELLEKLPADLLSRANAAEMRRELGIGANDSLSDATVDRLRLFVLLRASRPIEAPAYLLERRKTLMGAKSAVVCDGYVIATSRSDELLLTCSNRDEEVLCALIATAIADHVDHVIVDVPTTALAPATASALAKFNFNRTIVGGGTRFQRDIIQIAEHHKNILNAIAL
jgi:hypothetical protein